MKTEDRGGGLAVEDRSAAAGPTIEARVIDALRDVRKGETRALSTSSAAAIAPPELSTFLFDKLRAASVALASGVRVIATDRESIQFPQLTSDVSPAFYAELDTIAAADPGFATLTATPKKIAHRVELSNEVIDDSEPSVVETINAHLMTMLGLKLDAGIFEGSGAASPPTIRGLQGVAGIQSVVMGTNGAAFTSLDPIIDAIGLLEAANVPPPYAIVFHPRTWTALRKLKETGTSVQPVLAPDPPAEMVKATLFGVPVLTTSQLSTAETQGTATNASSAYVYAPNEVVLVRRQDAEIELDRSRLFDRDGSEMRGKLRADLLVPNPAAVVRVRGIVP